MDPLRVGLPQPPNDLGATTDDLASADQDLPGDRPASERPAPEHPQQPTQPHPEPQPTQHQPTQPQPTPTQPTPVGDRRAVDEDLVARLLSGDEDTFARVVTDWSPSMLRLARGFVSSAATAEEVVQEAWLAVLAGLPRFEGRSSLRTWVHGIAANLARRRGSRDARVIPAGDPLGDESGPTVDSRRFRGPGDPWAGGWTPQGAPVPWGPERSLLAGEVRALLAEALEQLPERQRTVVALRDVHGLSSDEVGEALGISPGNQRVLLHRGRARLRRLLEDYLRTEEASA